MTFRVFFPVFQEAQTYAPEFYFPCITAGAVNNSMTAGSISSSNYYDMLRIGWEVQNNQYLNFVHWVNRAWRPWFKSTLLEPGYAPSLPIMNSSEPLTDSGMVRKSVAFVGLQSNGVTNSVRVTTGWFPLVSQKYNFQKVMPIWTMSVDTTYGFSCPRVSIISHWNPGLSVVPYNPGPSLKPMWRPTPLGLYAIFEDEWTHQHSPVEFRSDSFTIHANDSIFVGRRIDTLDLATLISGLSGPSDYVMVKTVLRKEADSSYLMTLDSMVVTQSAVLLPGSGLDTAVAKAKFPYGASTTTAFAAIEITRGDTTDNITRNVMEVISDSSNLPAYKRVEQNQAAVPRELIGVSVIPNPLSLMASVVLTLPAEAMTRVELYDLLGHKVQTLYANAASGELQLTLDGKELHSGTYLLRVQFGNNVVTRTVELVK
jgi:hypothetical protein